MTQSTYKIILSSDATRDSSRYIQHYGVKGMKWGVRRTPEQLGHHRAKKKQFSEIGRLKYNKLINDPWFLVEVPDAYLPAQVITKIDKETYDNNTNRVNWQKRDELLKQAADRYIKPHVDEFINKMSKVYPKALTDPDDELLLEFDFLRYLDQIRGGERYPDTPFIK